jgi:AraC-like DNA-binding protein
MRFLAHNLGLAGFDPPTGADPASGIAMSLSDRRMPLAVYAPRFVRDWMEPQGLAALILVTVTGNDAGMALLLPDRNRSRGPADQGAIERTQVLIPDIRRAIALGSYLLHTTQDVAAQLLLSGTSQVAQIAYAVGFGSAAHFSTVFSQRFGLTPRACRLRAGVGLTGPQESAGE